MLLVSPSSSLSINPSVSVVSAFPRGAQATSMNGNSAFAFAGLYGVVHSFVFLSRFLTAFRRCHQHSCTFASHTSYTA